MAAHLARFTGPQGVLFVGKAQEKATVFRTEKRRNRQTGQPYHWLVRSTAMVNQYYFYAVDGDFGPNTRASVEAFQKWGHVGVDGIVGDQTWSVSLHALSATLETQVGLEFVIG